MLSIKFFIFVRLLLQLTDNMWNKRYLNLIVGIKNNDIDVQSESKKIKIKTSKTTK